MSGGLLDSAGFSKWLSRFSRLCPPRDGGRVKRFRLRLSVLVLPNAQRTTLHALFRFQLSRQVGQVSTGSLPSKSSARGPQLRHKRVPESPLATSQPTDPRPCFKVRMRLDSARRPHDFHSWVRSGACTACSLGVSAQPFHVATQAAPIRAWHRLPG